MNRNKENSGEDAVYSIGINSSASQLMKMANRLLGKRLFTSLMKASFYGHFVAGEDQVKITPVLER